VQMSWLWKIPSHINILESHAFVSLLRSLLEPADDQRFSTLLDSRVAKGSRAKGRSSARALRPSPQLSSGLYPAADAPTRDRDLPEAARHSFSETVSTARARALHAIGLSRHASGWVRLTVLLLILPRAEADGLFGFPYKSGSMCLHSMDFGFSSPSPSCPSDF
jgi:hypothetical protein